MNLYHYRRPDPSAPSSTPTVAETLKYLYGKRARERRRNKYHYIRNDYRRRKRQVPRLLGDSKYPYRRPVYLYGTTSSSSET